MERARRVDRRRRRRVDTSKLNNKNPLWWDATLQGSKRVNIYEKSITVIELYTKLHGFIFLIFYSSFSFFYLFFDYLFKERYNFIVYSKII